MARAYVNFYARLDPGGFGRSAQAFVGQAQQPHWPEGEVGAGAAAATAVEMLAGTEYAEIVPTEGDVFACILPAGTAAAERAAAGVRIGEGQRIALSRGRHSPAAAALYLWAA